MPDKKKQLKKHKAIATGLFILMALVYATMVYFEKHNPANWMPYVKAFSEAAMVGALADWFAVTALFKYPMGLKIPHTNLIENSKDVIGDNLGDFVTENFLTSENIRPYIEKIDLASFIGSWLAIPKNQETTEIEISKLLHNIVINLDEKTVTNFLTQKAEEGINAIEIQQFVAQGILYAVEQEEHNHLIDLILPKAQEYVNENREAIYEKVVEKKPILGLIGGKAVTNQLIGGITTFLDDVAENPNHKIRQELTERLLELSKTIATEPHWETKFQSILSQFITTEKIASYVGDFWISLKDTLLEQLENRQSVLRTYIRQNLQAIEQNLQKDKTLQDKINLWIRHAIYKMALKNTKEVGHLIKNTVAHWDGKELSQKLELEVGKDLQFIRINGTLVGGLVGLLIYIITHILF